MKYDGEVEALRSLVSLPWITQQHFIGMLQARGCLFPFRMAPVLPLRTACIADILSQASLRDVQRQRCWKRGRSTCSGDGQSLWDYCTAQLSDLSVPLTGEVRRSPEPSARPSAVADSEERQICTTCLFAKSVGLCLCFLPSCAMYEDKAAGSKRGSGDGQRLSFYDHGTTERSFNAVERWGLTLTWTVCRAADSEDRQICTTCFFAEGVGLWRDDGLMLSPFVEHTSVWEGVGGRVEIWRGIPEWNTKDKLAKPQTATGATAQWPKYSSTRTTRAKEQ